MPKKILEENYIRAFNALYGEYLSADKTELVSPVLDPEQLLLRREAYDRLSAEAKEMIAIILEAPNEILELLITPKQQRITKRLVRKYFSVVWNSRFITDLTMQELTVWANQL